MLADVSGTGPIAVLVPVKSFADAKARLADVLSPSERASLARTMAESVLRAARPLPVWVVCDTDEVASWAAEAGADVLRKPGRGLNGAVDEGVRDLATLGVDIVVVAHADLPHADDFARLLADHDANGVTLVPDRHLDGTNVAIVPASSGFVFAYGPGSFRNHEAEAARLGLTVRVVDDERFAWDVDRPDDLVTPTWSTTR